MAQVFSQKVALKIASNLLCCIVQQPPSNPSILWFWKKKEELSVCIMQGTWVESKN